MVNIGFGLQIKLQPILPMNLLLVLIAPTTSTKIK